MNDEDEDRDPNAIPSRQADTFLQSGWKTNFREGDGDHQSISGSGLTSKGHAMSDHNTGTTKRINSEASSSAGSKRPKLLYSARTSLCKSIANWSRGRTDLLLACGANKRYQSNSARRLV